ncbi:MAG: YjbE family putative metal transport protein [Burkholderiales bacterium]|nr:YjbE family putative metal transport protein [Burkholderiales bacterium]
MDFETVVNTLGKIGQISFLDLLLSGDNALVIALACRALPAQLVPRAIGLGTTLAIVLRVVLTALTGVLLGVSYLKLVGAALLIVIAIKLMLDNDADDEHDASQTRQPSNDLMTAIMIIISADLALSLDNVVALAAAAQGSLGLLAFGLLLSMPLLMYGSLFISRLLGAYPLLIPAGSAMLGAIAGQIAVADPVWADWVSTQAPALNVVVPALCAVFVIVEAGIVLKQRPTLTAPAPLELFGRIGARLAGQAAPAPQTIEVNAASPQPALAAHITASTPEAVQPSPVLDATVKVPEPTPRRQPKPEIPIADPVQQSRSLSTAVNLAKLLVAVVGTIAFGWILLHLLTQGFLPPPTRPPHG